MKNNKMKSIASSLVMFMILALSACNLSEQEKFEFNPQTPPLVTFKDKTAFQWMQGHPGADFNYMLDAIAVTGLQAEYETNANQRTYFLLKDAAFTATNGVLQIITGSKTGSITTLTDPVKINKLRNLLKYHIIDQYIDQGPDVLYVMNKFYFFQTLLPGEVDGKMSIRRDERFRMVINDSSLLPSTKLGTNGLLHNYIFKNGVGHLSSTYLRSTAF